MSAYRVRAEDLINGVRKLRNMYVGAMAYEQDGLKLGQLKGNRFAL